MNELNKKTSRNQVVIRNFSYDSGKQSRQGLLHKIQDPFRAPTLLPRVQQICQMTKPTKKCNLFIDPFVPIAPFLYSLKTPENRKVI